MKTPTDVKTECSTRRGQCTPVALDVLTVESMMRPEGKAWAKNNLQWGTLNTQIWLLWNSRVQSVLCVFQDCSLQIHNSYSVHRGINAHPPLSIEDAVGLIIVNGKQLPFLLVLLVSCSLLVDPDPSEQIMDPCIRRKKLCGWFLF